MGVLGRLAGEIESHCRLGVGIRAGRRVEVRENRVIRVGNGRSHDIGHFRSGDVMEVVVAAVGDFRMGNGLPIGVAGNRLAVLHPFGRFLLHRLPNGLLAGGKSFGMVGVVTAGVRNRGGCTRQDTRLGGLRIRMLLEGRGQILREIKNMPGGRCFQRCVGNGAFCIDTWQGDITVLQVRQRFPVAE